jgi:hypothetical protein
MKHGCCGLPRILARQAARLRVSQSRAAILAGFQELIPVYVKAALIAVGHEIAIAQMYVSS